MQLLYNTYDSLQHDAAALLPNHKSNNSQIICECHRLKCCMGLMLGSHNLPIHHLRKGN